VTGPGQPTPEDQQEYIGLVLGEIAALDGYSQRQLRLHRLARIVVIAAGSAVPVLAAWSAVPRPVLALAGACAVAAEGVAQLFQFQTHAVNTLNTRNALEREVNRFLMAVGQRTFATFAERVEDIREAADHGSREAWQKSTTPTIGQQPTP